MEALVQLRWNDPIVFWVLKIHLTKILKYNVTPLLMVDFKLPKHR